MNENEKIDSLYDDIFYLIKMNRELIHENITLHNELLKMKRDRKELKCKYKKSILKKH